MAKNHSSLSLIKAIYGWDEPKTLNMSIHGLKGRAHDWAHGLEAAEKNLSNILRKS